MCKSVNIKIFTTIVLIVFLLFNGTAQNNTNRLQIPVFNNNTEYKYEINREVTAPVSTIEFSKNNRLLASGGYNELLIWNLPKATLEKRIKLNPAIENLRCLAFINNNMILVGGGEPARNGFLAKLNIKTGESVWETKTKNDVITSIAISKSGGAFLGNASGTIIEINLADGTIKNEIDKLSAEISELKLAPGDSLLAIGSYAGDLILKNLNSKLNWMNAKDKNAVTGLHFLKNRQLLYSTGNIGKNGTLKRIPVKNNSRKKIRINTDTGKNILAQKAGTGFSCLATNKKGNTTILPCHNGEIMIFRSWEKDTPLILNGHSNAVSTVSFAPNQRLFATADLDATIVIWGINGMRLITLSQLETNTDKFVMVTRNGFFSGLEQGEIKTGNKKINPAFKNNKQKMFANINSYLKLSSK